MPYSNIDAVISDNQRTAVFEAIAAIEANLEFLINLTNEERRALPKMGSSSQSFVSKALEIASRNAQFVPPYVDVEGMHRDYQLALRLQAMEMKLASLLEKVSDTHLAVGSEAYLTGLSVYNSLKAASKVNVPGAKALVAELAERFATAPEESSVQALPPA